MKQILSKKFSVIGQKLTIKKMRKNFIKIWRVERLKIQNLTLCRNKKIPIRHFLSFLNKKLTARIVSNSKTNFSWKLMIQKTIFFKKQLLQNQTFQNNTKKMSTNSIVWTAANDIIWWTYCWPYFYPVEWRQPLRKIVLVGIDEKLTVEKMRKNLIFDQDLTRRKT